MSSAVQGLVWISGIVFGGMTLSGIASEVSKVRVARWEARKAQSDALERVEKNNSL